MCETLDSEVKLLAKLAAEIKSKLFIVAVFYLNTIVLQATEL